jgi:hypothetical protein
MPFHYDTQTEDFAFSVMAESPVDDPCSGFFTNGVCTHDYLILGVEGVSFLCFFLRNLLVVPSSFVFLDS